MQKQAAEILASWLPRLPNHPGVSHYSFHAFDSPELAYLGLDAARRYARIAPAGAHALHMPSHIFIRLGLWPEAIASNLDSAASARAGALRAGGGRVALEEFHALDYLEYAYLQAGDDERARAIAEQVARTTAIEAATTAPVIAQRGRRLKIEKSISLPFPLMNVRSRDRRGPKL